VERRETERILKAIRDVRDARERAAIATVVRIRGSAYRREGTRILVRQDGSYECLLSGGCLEPAVADAAARVIATGEPVIVSYDLEEDSVWGLGIGCSGAVDIRIERLENDPLTGAWLDLLSNGRGGVLITTLTGPVGRLLVSEDGAMVGTLGDQSLDAAAASLALARLAEPHPHSGPDHYGDLELFVDVNIPPPRLVVFGAGSDAPPLAEHAWTLGFAVTIVDVREAFLTPDRFPGALLIPAHFNEFRQKVGLDRRSFVVIMNHHLERDWESLRFALDSPAPYVGVLGPRSRFKKLTTALEAAGYVPDAAALARVRSPVGLALGAETPEEIAVSVMGEIVAVRRGFQGGFLSGREDSLHRPASRSMARS
jgi:xanthine/CO dehydrogenase XdhC/CoxF family maturation factor